VWDGETVAPTESGFWSLSLSMGETSSLSFMADIWSRVAEPKGMCKVMAWNANRPRLYKSRGFPYSSFFRSAGAPGFSLGTFEGCTVLLEFRRVPMHTACDKDALETAQSDVGEFAAALSRLDSTVSGLLNCRSFFYSPAPQPTFGLIYHLPHERQREDVVTSFKDLLRARDARGRRQRLRYSLNQRFEFVKKLTTAVLFVHAIGWVYKAIMPQNVLLLGRESVSGAGDDGEKKDKGRRWTWSVTSPYLVGFEVARSDDADTLPGARGAPLPLDVALYMHPSLQDTTSHVRCTMAHDVYSLGVVLLELGI
jgi:hypothetical protein